MSNENTLDQTHEHAEPTPAEPDVGDAVVAPLRERLGSVPFLLLALLIGGGLGLGVGYLVWSGDDATVAPPAITDGGEPLSDADGLVNEGIGFLDSGDYVNAEQRLQQALALDPNNAFALYNTGLIRQLEGNHDEAVTYYRRTLDVDPGFVAARYNLGLALSSQGETEAAIGELRRVLEIAPEHASAMFNLGQLLIARGDVEEGDDLVAQSIRLNPALREVVVEED